MKIGSNLAALYEQMAKPDYFDNVHVPLASLEKLVEIGNISEADLNEAKAQQIAKYDAKSDEEKKMLRVKNAEGYLALSGIPLQKDTALMTAYVEHMKQVLPSSEQPKQHFKLA